MGFQGTQALCQGDSLTRLAARCGFPVRVSGQFLSLPSASLTGGPLGIFHGGCMACALAGLPGLLLARHPFLQQRLCGLQREAPQAGTNSRSLERMAFNTSQGLVLVVTATLSPLQRPQCPEDLRVDINSALLPPSSLPKSLGSVEVLGPLFSQLRHSLQGVGTHGRKRMFT